MGSNHSYIILVILVNSFGAQYVLGTDPQPAAVQAQQSEATQNGASIHYPSVKDIVDRLHQLDVDIGRLMFNSTSLFSPPVEQLTYSTETTGVVKSGDSTAKFTEVLTDLDSLQDEVNVIIKNVTRTRQYNLLVRLRPLNTLLYRIRNNLYLMRNSLIALNTVTSLEKIANSVLDTTLTVFLKPDGTTGNDELTGDENPLDVSTVNNGGTNDLSSLDSLKPDPNEEAAIAEAEAAAANDQDLNRPNGDLDGDQGFGAGISSMAPTSTTTTTMAPSTTTTTTTTSPAPVFEQPPRLKPDSQPQQPVNRPLRIRIQQPSRSPAQTSTTVTTTTTTTTPEVTPSTTTTTTTVAPIVNSNRNTNISRFNSTRPQGTRVRPSSSRPTMALEMATE